MSPINLRLSIFCYGYGSMHGCLPEPGLPGNYWGQNHYIYVPAKQTACMLKRLTKLKERIWGVAQKLQGRKLRNTCWRTSQFLRSCVVKRRHYKLIFWTHFCMFSQQNLTLLVWSWGTLWWRCIGLPSWSEEAISGQGETARSDLLLYTGERWPRGEIRAWLYFSRVQYTICIQTLLLHM
jgi:hypothetical protein